MPVLFRFKALVAIAAILTLSACHPEDISSPDTRASADLHLLHLVPGTPSLVTTHKSFYAVKGRATSTSIYFHALPGQTDSLTFLEFRVGANSLAQRPDGSAIAQGDSVLITLDVVDPYHLVVNFQPSGLRFSAADQPLLRISWAACGTDLNYDGTVDGSDSAVASQLGIWRQESVDLPWFREPSVVSTTLREVSAPLSGFTGYALAY